MESTQEFSLPGWQTDRLLQFLNLVENPEEIAQFPDDSIGIGLAKRIIEARSQLPNGRFRSLDELDAIHGIGEIRIVEMAQFFSGSAADLFQDHMKATVLTESWVFEHYSSAFTEEEFREFVRSPSSLDEWVWRQCQDIMFEKADYRYPSGVLESLLQQAPVQANYNAMRDALEMALWVTKVDHDDDITFEQIHNATSKYFSLYEDVGEIQLYMYRGFELSWLYPSGRTAPDLAVTVNTAERVVSLWVCAWEL